MEIMEVLFDMCQSAVMVAVGANLHWLQAKDARSNNILDLMVKVSSSYSEIKAGINLMKMKMILNRSDDTGMAQMRQLKEAAYQAEDVFDYCAMEYYFKKFTGKRKVRESAISTFNDVKSLFLVRNECVMAKELLALFSELKSQIRFDDQNIQIAETRETSSHLPNDFKLFGHDKEKEMILQIISTNNKGPTVLPIVGMGGVGKTALAQFIFNHQTVQDSFQLRSWIYVSNNFDPKRIIQEIMNSYQQTTEVTVPTEKKLDDLVRKFGPTEIKLDDLVNKFVRTVRNRKLFLVLDDVQNVTGDSWEKLHAALMCATQENMILVTSQNRRLTNQIRAMDTIVLDVLQDEHSYALFNHYAFDSANISETKKNKLEQTGNAISRKLHGLPLAGITIGKLLRSNLDENKWKRVSELEWWNLDVGWRDILPSLAQVYLQLNSGQKQCFTYCSIFPRGYKFEKQRLVQMWMSNNFIIPEFSLINEETNEFWVGLENKGRQWLDQLVEMGFLQAIEDGNSYVMNDVMRDLATAVSMDECLLFTDESEGIKPTTSLLAVKTNGLWLDWEPKFVKHLRTILFMEEYDSRVMYNFLDRMMDKLNNVRVLDLSHTKIQCLPHSIGCLKHLRFLDLSYTNIEEISVSIGECLHLQILDLRFSKIKIIPNEITQLMNLKHLYADAKIVSRLSNIGRLKYLQELEEFHVQKKTGYRITELENMRSITGAIHILNLENVRSNEEAKAAGLRNKRYLKKVTFTQNSREVNNYSPTQDILEALQPHPNMEELIINGYVDSVVPNWMANKHDCINLQHVSLIGCLNLVALPPLGQLPSLKLLSLQTLLSVRQIDRNLYGDDGIIFPSLCKLQLSGLPALENWSPVGDTEIFPCLTKLEIEHCSLLTRVPLLSMNLPLKELVLSYPGNYAYALPLHLPGLASLTNLSISHCNQIMILPFQTLNSLDHLKLDSCLQFSLERGFQSLINLKTLQIIACPNLFIDRLNAESLPLLEYLCTDDSLLVDNNFLMIGLPLLNTLKIQCSAIEQFGREQEAWFQQLTCLNLEFYSCRILKDLPTNLSTLASVKQLIISYCPDLESLPEEGVPPSLEELNIYECSTVLMERCKPLRTDWTKITHVRKITIGGYNVNR